MNQFRVALAHLASRLFDKGENSKKAEKAICMSASQDVVVIPFSGLFSASYSLGKRVPVIAESRDSLLISGLAERARWLASFAFAGTAFNSYIYRASQMDLIVQFQQ